MTLPCLRLSPVAAATLLVATLGAHAQETASSVASLPEIDVLGTAEETLRQAPGVSTITAEDLQRRPPANDLSEIIRTQPGVNLTGNSTSGQRGNNRQIDIRGMGPENTLILIDGRPVGSRGAVRYGWRGERDTRGDSNWVPPEQVERIEVLRGPAAARYGNGAAGGVVNIITKAPAREMQGSVTLFASEPQDGVDGATRRAGFSLSGPLSEAFSYRLWGNVNKTDADDPNINAGHTTPRTGIYAGTWPAGREGVRNRDLGARLSWRLAPGHTLDLDAGFSRQGNIYSGDTQNTNNFTTLPNGRLAPTSQRVQDMLGRETNVMYRENFALTHRGRYGAVSSTTYLQAESTRNKRLDEGLAGGTEGLFASDSYSTARLRNTTLHSEASVPTRWGGGSQMWTVGGEWVRQTLEDPNSMRQTTAEGGAPPGLRSTGRDTRSAASIASLFAEGNIGLGADTILTPGLRYDRHSEVGSNWSPSLNLSHTLAPGWTAKAGIARAYKAPNLYQTNPDYLLYSRGQGCWGGQTACYLQGNADLRAETSVNKELGIEYRRDALVAGLTWFRNDYHDKIEAGLSPIGRAAGGVGTWRNANIFQWQNVPRALVQGLEGTVQLPLARNLHWSNNFTYMIDSVNKTTGERLSVIPKYTVNSALDWRATEQLSLQATVSLYGPQKPKRFDYNGNPVSGFAATELDSYALVGISGTYVFSPQLRLTAGISNLFDKRLYRRGNASGVGSGANVISGAGAATYNEPGRAFHVSLTATF